MPGRLESRAGSVGIEAGRSVSEIGTGRGINVLDRRRAGVGCNRLRGRRPDRNLDPLDLFSAQQHVALAQDPVGAAPADALTVIQLLDRAQAGIVPQLLDLPVGELAAGLLLSGPNRGVERDRRRLDGSGRASSR